jgi:hypothetical protein
VATDDDR